MGKIFEDYTNNTPMSTYGGNHFEQIKALTDNKVEAFNKNKANIDALDIMANNLDVGEADFHHKQDFINSIKQQSADLIAKGDYENAGLLVQKMMKDYQMNNNLQGALTKESQKKAYEQDLADRLRGYTEVKEKDGTIKKVDLPDKIDQSTYNYGMQMSKENNKTSVNYNPQTGKIENGFSAPKLIGDKSKEIYDKMASRLDKFKEDGIMYANGHTYKTAGLGNAEYVLEDGKQVSKNRIFDALKTEIEGTSDYMDWINQTKQIRKYGQLQNDNRILKGKLNIQDDFKGYLPDEIKAAANGGVSLSHINDSIKENERLSKLPLNKGGITKEDYENNKLKLKLQQDEYNKINLDDEKILNKAWDREQHNQILNSLVMPSVIEGAHQTAEHKLYEDSLQKDIALESYKNRMKNVGITTYNIGNTSEYSGEDYQKIKEQLPELQKAVDNAKGLYEAAKGTDREKQREQEYNQAVNELNIGKEQVNQFYIQAKDDVKVKEKIFSNLDKLIINTSGQTNQSNKNIFGLGSDDIENLQKIAKDNKDYRTVGLLESLKNSDNFPNNLKKELIEKLNNSEYILIITNILNNNNKNAEIFNATTAYTPNNERKPINYYDNLDNILQEKYNDKALTYATDSGIIKDNGFEHNSNETNVALGKARSLLGSTTDLKLPNGDNFNNIISNTQKPKFWKSVHEAKNNQNYKVASEFSMDNTDVAVGMNRTDGRLFLTINPKDKEGNPLTYGEDAEKANKQAIQVTIGDENAARDIYYQYAKVFDESGNHDKALEIRAEANFANIINRLVVGKTYSDPINIDMGQKGTLQFNVIGKGKESELVSADGKTKIPFADKTQLKKTLETVLESK